MKRVFGEKIFAIISFLLIISTGAAGLVVYLPEKPSNIVCYGPLNNDTDGVLLGICKTENGTGWLEEINGTLVLHLEGTGHEMGYQHGYLLKEEIERSIIGYLYGGRKIYGYEPELKDFYRIQESYIPQRFKDEMQGIADASGVPLIDIQVAQIVSEYWKFACRQVTTWGNATSDGHLHHARSLGFPIDFRDLSSGVALQDHALVIVTKPDGYNPFVSLSWPGFVGSVTGMNVEGISLAINTGFTNDTTPYGIPRPFRLRRVLEEANSISEVITLLNESKTIGWVGCLGDGKVPEAYALEMTGNLFYSGPWNHWVEYYNDEECRAQGFPDYEPLEGCIIRFASQYRHPDLAETRIDPQTGEPVGYPCQGQGYLDHYNMVKDNYGDCDADILEAMASGFSDPMGDILHQCVLSSSTLDFRVSNAIGSYGAHNFPMQRFNLNNLLDSTPPTGGDLVMPEVKITSPEGGSMIRWFLHQKITIRGTASDNIGISRVEIMVDDQDYVPVEGTASWSKTINTRSWEPGSWHRIKVRAIDESGNGAIDIIGLWKFGIVDFIYRVLDLIKEILASSQWQGCGCS